jgi:hypothetical protein
LAALPQGSAGLSAVSYAPWSGFEEQPWFRRSFFVWYSASLLARLLFLLEVAIVNQMQRRVLLVFFSLLVTGCGSPDKEKLLKTVEGLQDQNMVLRDRVKELKGQVADLKTELSAIKRGMETDTRTMLEKLRKQHETEVAGLRQLYEEKVKTLEGDNADLYLRLGKTTKERLVLDELVGAGQRLPEGERSRFGIERSVYLLLLFVALGLTGFVSARYYVLRLQLHRLVVHRASQFQPIEVTQ